MTLLASSVHHLTHSPQISRFTSSIDMREVVAIVLGGGQGTRLSPLTLTRCKPAVCFGGKYRLIDIPISNAIHSGCRKICILTQFLSTSLHQHLFKTYRHGQLHTDPIEILSAEQGPGKNGCYKGTADAVRQNLEYFAAMPGEYFLILSGDQIYHLNFQHMVRFAKETQADAVIAVLPVAEPEAKRMGVLKINEERFITDFYEKPQTRDVLDHLQLPEFNFKQLADVDKKYLGSMGIYLFKRKVLLDLLQQDLREDFGQHLIPTCVQRGKTAAYFFGGYWEDIGTISSFFHANMGLTKQKPAFDCYDERYPIFSAPSSLPPPRIVHTQVTNSIICEGSIVEAEQIQDSILGLRTVIKGGTKIRNSYVMGNDHYAPPVATESGPAQLTIGENCTIDHAIIDKHVHIGNNVRLINKDKLTQYTGDHLCIRDGIIVVTTGANIPDGFCL